MLLHAFIAFFNFALAAILAISIIIPTTTMIVEAFVIDVEVLPLSLAWADVWTILGEVPDVSVGGVAAAASGNLGLEKLPTVGAGPEEPRMEGDPKVGPEGSSTWDKFLPCEI